MATNIGNIDVAKMSIKWQARYTGVDINRKTGATESRGVVRGFTPTGVTTGMSGTILTLAADTKTGDSVMVLRQTSAGDPYGLTYREEGNIDLSLPSLPVSGTVFIGVEHIYAFGTATSAVWKYITYTEYNTGSYATMVIVCAYNIDQNTIEMWPRDCQWMWKSNEDENGWIPAIPDAFCIEDMWKLYSVDVDSTIHDDTQSSYLLYVDGDGVSGGNSLKADFSNMYFGQVDCLDTFAVKSGDRLVGSFWIKRDSSYVDGQITNAISSSKNTVRVGIRYYDEIWNVIGTAYLAAKGNAVYDITNIAADTWTLISGDLNTQSGVYNVVPASARYARFFIIFNRKNNTPASTVGIAKIDRPQVWIIPTQSNSKNWKDVGSRRFSSVTHSLRMYLKNYGFSSTYSDFELYQKTDGKLYIERPLGAGTAAQNKLTIGSSIVNIDTIHFGDEDVTGDTTQNGTVNVTGTITGTDVEGTNFAYTPAKSFIKSYHVDGWFATAAANATTTIVRDTSGDPKVTAAANTVFKIPLNMVKSTISSITFTWNRGGDSATFIRATIIAKDVSSNAETNISTTFSCPEATSSSTFTPALSITRRNGEEYYMKIELSTGASMSFTSFEITHSITNIETEIL